MNPSVADFLRREVADWDDDVVATARFKAFSGQRSDWEHRFLFWRDLILKVARHLRVFTINPSEVKTSWFNRGGLTPLCMDNVLLEMYRNGDFIRSRDLMNFTGGRLYNFFKRVGNLVGVLSKPQEVLEDRLILKILLEERATELLKVLSDSHWTPNCVITMEKFKSICRGSEEANTILSYLSRCGKAQYLSTGKVNLIEGVKIALAPSAALNISSIDCDALHLIWTAERLHQQLDVIDRRCGKLRKSALHSVRSGNKQAALQDMRQLKLSSETREKCTSLLNRVEEVISILENAESTKQVSEAIKIGAQAIKENSVSFEEVHSCLQELDDRVASQKEVEEALESMPLQCSSIADEDVEEEFMKLELELGDEIPLVQVKTVADNTAEEVKVQESVAALNESLSNLRLEAA